MTENDSSRAVELLRGEAEVQEPTRKPEQMSVAELEAVCEWYRSGRTDEYDAAKRVRWAAFWRELEARRPVESEPVGLGMCEGRGLGTCSLPAIREVSVQPFLGHPAKVRRLCGMHAGPVGDPAPVAESVPDESPRCHHGEAGFCGVCEVEHSRSKVKLLLTDSEGWSGLYGEGDAAKLGEAMRHAELEGEPLFTRAYLVLVSGSVVPAKVEGQTTPFDEEDYATASITFTPDPQGSLMGAVAAREPAVAFRVSWRVDGRS